MTRIIVTGGAGFIGSNYVHHVLHSRAGAPAAACCPDHARYGDGKADPDLRLLNVDKLTYAGDPANLHGVDGHKAYQLAKVDITDAVAVEETFKQFQPDVVVHFAAESHVDRSIEAGDVFVKTNVMGTQTLLDAARRHDVGQFLHISTDEVYGSRQTGSFKETDGFHTASPYSASKAGSDLLVMAHHTTYGLKTSITRCTNNYGPRQHPEKLLPKVVTLAMSDKPLPIYGTGMNVRDWLYVKDHCAAIDTVLGLKDWGGIYNIGARDEKPNLDVVRTVLKRLGKPESLITYVKDRPGHDWRYSLDDSKLRSKGWKPRTTFEQGLDDTIAWLKARAALERAQ
ncbi:MAG TPA: dTDP-glucose 4,6-dehydratase [Candidatus Thermoplasmatota archaeon]|nr:dTDP-glucose 4,6-dehydratase [Candidatus Thermoplasmatota archaeon]